MPIDDNFISGFTIKRPTQVSDGAGSFTPGLSTVATVSGQMRQLLGNEIIENDKLGFKTTNRFYCMVTDIKPFDKLLNPKDGLNYEVRRVHNPMSMDEFLQVDCEFKEEYQ